MHALLLALLLAAPVDDARALEEQGRDLMDTLQFQPALEKLQAANRLQSTPERLMAIAHCHRVLAYQSAREASQALHVNVDADPVWRELARTLSDLEKARVHQPRHDRTEIAGGAVQQPGLVLTPLDEQQPAPPLLQHGPFLQGAPVEAPAVAVAAAPTGKTLRRLGIATGAGSLALFSTAIATHLIGASAASSLNSSPQSGAQKQDTINRVNTLSSLSVLSAGAGVALAAVAAVLLLRD